MRLLNVSLTNDRGILNLPLGRGLTLLQGPMGCGKSMLVRDTLLLLTAGKIPGKRTVSSLGERVSAGVTLELDDGEVWPILRQGTKVSVMGQDGLSSAGAVTGALASKTGMSPKDLAESVYKTDEDVRNLLLSSKKLLDFANAAAGLSWFASTAGALSNEASRLEPAPVLDDENRRQLEVHKNNLEADLRRFSQRLEKLSQAISRMAPHQQYCEGLANSSTPDQVEQVKQQARAFLAEQGLAGKTEYLTPLYPGPVLAFAAEVAKELGNNQGVVEQSTSLKKAVIQGNHASGPVLQALDTLTRADSVQTASAKDITDAVSWLKVLNEYREEVNSLTGQVRSVNTELADIQTRLAADLQGRNGKERAKYNRAMELYSLFLRNKADASLQDVATGWVVGRVLGTATYLLQRVIPEACLRQSVDGSVKTSIDGRDIPAEQLSNGQILVCALALQLGIMAVFGTAVPFLVLDDITGACGDKAQNVVTMLQEAAEKVVKRQIVLLTSDRQLRAQCMRTL